MKKFSLLFIMMVTVTLAYGQKSIDDLFDKYAGKDGFTTVTINGGLLKLAKIFDNGDSHDNDLPAKVTEIRILTQEDDDMKVDNFYDLVMKDIDLSKYEEFMRVKESDQEMRMLVRTDGDKFKEFLLISGGKDNAIIQIKGSMTYEEAKKLSTDAGKKHSFNITDDHK